jgi:hypothetical protein
MSPIQCPFCDTPSPPGAKFCSACGGALYLAPCPNCGAVNDVSAVSCYQCRVALPGRKAEGVEALVVASAETKVAAAGTPYARIVAAVAALVVVGALGYYAYQQHRPAGPSSPGVGGSSGNVNAEDAGAIKAQAADKRPLKGNGPGVASDAALLPALEASPAKDLTPPAVAATLGTQPGFRPASKAAAPATARAGSPRADRQPVELPRPKPAAASSGIPAGDCTAAVAALGLCQDEASRTGPARPVPAARLPATEQADAAATAPVVAPALREEPCTAAVAALGLCSPASRDQGKGE